MSYKILFRRGTSTEWSTANPILAYGEVGAESGVAPQLKVGDGVTPWNDLPYAGSGIGVIPGGEAGALLTKITTDNYDTDWITRGDLADATEFADRFDRKVSYDVRDFGAYCNGVADDTTAVQNAVIAAYNAGGGSVRFPAGTILISSPIMPRSNVHIHGAGIEATTIKIANNANCAAFQTNNFAALDAGDTDGGAAVFSVTDLTIDGNRLFNVSSYGFRIYGRAFRLANIRIKDCVNYGLYSKWGTSTAQISPHDIMATVENVQAHDCGGDGIAWNGPHNSVFINTHSYRNARGFVFDLNGFDCTLVACSAYGAGQAWGYYLNVPDLTLVGCIAEGAGTSDTVGGQVYLGSTGTAMSGCTISSGGSGDPANNVRGLVVGGATQASEYDIYARFSSCTAGSIIFVNDGGGRINGMVSQASGAVQAGTVHSTTTLNLYVTGGATYSSPNTGPMKEASASFTLSKTHGSRFVRCTNNSRVTVTIPTDLTDDLPDGFTTTLYAEGLGGLTIATPNITLTGATPNKSVIRNQALTLIKTEDADTWSIIGGDLSSEVSGLWRAEINASAWQATAVGAWVSGTTGMFTYFSAVSDGTQHASIDYTVDLSPGTWSLKFFGYRGPGLGIATIKLDGATIGTIDLYAAAPAAYDSTITGITVSTDGAQTLQVVMATKNASSSGYQGNASWFTMWRTA